MLIRVVHHGDEHIEEHHQGDDVISAKHRGSYKLGELVVGLNVGHVQTDQTEYGPEQRLQCFEQPISREINYDQPSLEHFILRNTFFFCFFLALFSKVQTDDAFGFIHYDLRQHKLGYVISEHD